MNIKSEIAYKRLEKYFDKIEERARNKNQLLVRDGKGFLIIAGDGKECVTLEGYIKLPGNEYFVPIGQDDYSIYILPNEKVIVVHDEECEFLGYKTDNSEGCVMVIHAVTEQDDLLIVYVDDDIPAFISLDEFYELMDNGNSRIYQLVDTLLQKPLSTIIVENNQEREGQDDEWE